MHKRNGVACLVCRATRDLVVIRVTTSAIEDPGLEIDSNLCRTHAARWMLETGQITARLAFEAAGIWPSTKN